MKIDNHVRTLLTGILLRDIHVYCISHRQVFRTNEFIYFASGVLLFSENVSIKYLYEQMFIRKFL